MIDLIDSTTSDLMSAVSTSACSASVRTARSTATCALSDLGLNSRFSRLSKSVTGAASGNDVVCCWTLGSAMTTSPLVSNARWPLRGRHVFGLGRRRQRLQQRRVLQQLADQLLGSALAVHVGDE